MNFDYFVLTEKIKTNSKALFKFKVTDRVRITKYKITFSKLYNENQSREIFIIDFVLKANPWTYKIRDINREEVIGSFYENEMLLSKS